MAKESNLSTVPADKYVSGESARRDLETARVDNVELIRAKVSQLPQWRHSHLSCANEYSF